MVTVLEVFLSIKLKRITIKIEKKTFHFLPVFPHIVMSEGFGVALNVQRCHSPQKFNVLLRVKTTHVVERGSVRFIHLPTSEKQEQDSHQIETEELTKTEELTLKTVLFTINENDIITWEL